MSASAGTSRSLDVSGSFEPVPGGFEVALQLRNREADRLTDVRLEADGLGGRRRELRTGGLEPHEARAIRLGGISAPTTGVHALVVFLQFNRIRSGGTERASEAAPLLLAFGAVPAPVVRMTLADAALDQVGRTEVHLESADGRAHEVRLCLRGPRGLTFDPADSAVIVPGRGVRAVPALVFRDAAVSARDLPMVGVAETRDGAATVSEATAFVRTGAWRLPSLHRVLLLCAALLLTWAAVRQRQNRP